MTRFSKIAFLAIVGGFLGGCALFGLTESAFGKLK